MKYLKRRWKYFFLYLILFFSFNLYFIFLMRTSHISWLFYLDGLLAMFLFALGVFDYLSFWRMQKEVNLLKEGGSILCQSLESDFENKDIAEHDVLILNEKLSAAFEQNCELSDFVAKWCHEFKIPLAAGLLIVEKIEDGEVRGAMREQLEKMNRQLNSMLLGAKLNSSLMDVKIRRVSLQDCVQASIRNYRFFLIQKKFSLRLELKPLIVYSDFSWLVYIIDQLISNAVKYAGSEPVLSIWSVQRPGETELWIEDNGDGIRKEDVRRIFEKGYVGSNYHNGAYKSTGMGLYLVSKIISRLEHQISVESEYGVFTRFCILFSV